MAEAVPFPACNIILKGSGCNELPIATGKLDNGSTVLVSRWQLTEAEKEAGYIFLAVWNAQHPPVSLRLEPSVSMFYGGKHKVDIDGCIEYVKKRADAGDPEAKALI